MSQNTALDTAFQHFYKKDYKKALNFFKTIAEDEETPMGVKVRVEQFQRMAESQLADKTDDQPPQLKDVSYFINLARYDEAEATLNDVDTPDHIKLYLRAEIALLQDKEDTAADLLQQAIAQDAGNTGYAINSPVFAEHLNNEKFAFLKKNLDTKE